VSDLFDGYGEHARGLTEAAFDEMVGRDGSARRIMDPAHASLGYVRGVTSVHASAHERHVAVGRGRDDSDVPPVKGIYAGNAEHTMKVGVHIMRTH
jgi:hypothetical protein